MGTRMDSGASWTVDPPAASDAVGGDNPVMGAPPKNGDEPFVLTPSPQPPPFSALPSLDAWPDYPLLLRLSPDVTNSDPGAVMFDSATGAQLDPLAPLSINNAASPIQFETKLFKVC